MLTGIDGWAEMTRLLIEMSERTGQPLVVDRSVAKLYCVVVDEKTGARRKKFVRRLKRS